MAWTAPRTWVAGETVTAALMNAHVRDNFLASAPLGKVDYFERAGTAVETLINGAWLERNGAAVSRTTYAAYFAVLNALSPALPFGSGNGSTTFNVADTRGRLLVHHAAGGHSDVDTLGDSNGGSLATQTPQHNTTISPNPHKHTYTGASTAQSGASGAAVFVVTSQPTNDTSLTSLSGGPGGSRPTDTPAYHVGGVYAVKALT